VFLKSGSGLFLILFLIAALMACSSPAPKVCAYAGDPTLPIAAQIVGYDPTLSYEAIPDGGQLELTPPPQGGYVLYVGAYATNLSACDVTVSAELVDPGTGSALTDLSARESDFSVKVDGYWSPTALDFNSDFPNIPACPGALGRGIVGVPAQVRVTITDGLGKTGTFTEAVTAVCSPGDGSCPCACGAADAGCD